MNIAFLDIDGVLADDTWRYHLAEDGKWREYFSLQERDPALQEGIDLHNDLLLAPDLEMAYLTGRREDTMGETFWWLSVNGFRTDIALFMKPWDWPGHTSDYKAAVVVAHSFEYQHVVLFDDDPKNVEAVQAATGNNDSAVYVPWGRHKPTLIKGR